MKASVGKETLFENLSLNLQVLFHSPPLSGKNSERLKLDHHPMHGVLQMFSLVDETSPILKYIGSPGCPEATVGGRSYKSVRAKSRHLCADLPTHIADMNMTFAHKFR